jgi:hypothetical protein
MSRCYARRGECEPGNCGALNGWTVPYQQRAHAPGVPSDAHRETTYRAVVDITVTYPSKTGVLTKPLPFVIDTGTPLTVIPRSLLGGSAFESEPGAVHDTVQDASGHHILGRRFWVKLSIRPQHATCNPLEFDRVNVFVPDTDVRLNLGLLGLDALRTVITVFDESRVIFRQASDPSAAPSVG